MSALDRVNRARALKLLGIAIFSTSLVASFAEFRKPPPRRAGYATPTDVSPPTDAHSLSYTELRGTTRGPSRSVYLSSIESLEARLPPLTEPFQREPGDRERMLEARAARRAYDGAPPTVPHPVDERAVPNCLVCHERGARIGQLRAPVMSHTMLGSCLQCHASGPEFHGSPVPTPLAPALNAFAPQPFGGLGARAWTGAPPTRPHTAAMRSNCGSCHGVAGDPGLRTSHPERQNCEQCHAGSDGGEWVLPKLAQGGGAL